MIVALPHACGVASCPCRRLMIVASFHARGFKSRSDGRLQHGTQVPCGDMSKPPSRVATVGALMCGRRTLFGQLTGIQYPTCGAAWRFPPAIASRLANSRRF